MDTEKASHMMRNEMEMQPEQQPLTICEKTMQTKNTKLNLGVGNGHPRVYDTKYSGGGKLLPSQGSLQKPYLAQRKVQPIVLSWSLSELGFQLQWQAQQTKAVSLGLSQSGQLKPGFSGSSG